MRNKFKAILLALTLVFGSATAYTAATAAPASAGVLCRSLGPYLTGYLQVTTHCSVYPDPVHNVIGTCIERLDYNYGWTNDDGPGWCNAHGPFEDTAPLNCTYGSSTVFRGSVISDDGWGWYISNAAYFYPC